MKAYEWQISLCHVWITCESYRMEKVTKEQKKDRIASTRVAIPRALHRNLRSHPPLHGHRATLVRPSHPKTPSVTWIRSITISWLLNKWAIILDPSIATGIDNALGSPLCLRVCYRPSHFRSLTRFEAIFISPVSTFALIITYLCKNIFRRHDRCVDTWASVFIFSWSSL